MGTTILAARIAVGLALAVAGVAKLASREDTRRTLRDFGVPSGLCAPVALGLPLVELATAALLLPTATAVVGGVAVATLMLLFSLAIVRVLMRGEAVRCNCFGALGAREVGWPELARNAVLGALGVFIAAAGPGERIGTAVADVSPWAVAAGAVLAVQLFVSYQLLRQNGRLLDRVRALEERLGRDAESAVGSVEIGDPAPQFALPDLDGELRTLGELLAPGRPLLLAFSDPDCAACSGLLPVLAHARSALAGGHEFAVITRGTADRARAWAGALALGPVLLQSGFEVSDRYGVRQVPSAALIGADGRLARALVVGPAAIEQLIDALPPVHLDPITVGAGG
jgi:peroxiredoxin